VSGIVGFVDNTPKHSNACEILSEMNETLKPRGMDLSGVWLSPCASIGHTQFAVSDSEEETQPMMRVYGDKRYVITYDGCLYNGRDVRRELERLGHSFRTRSDAEIVLQSYLQWGENCLMRFNGVFAFAVWDEHEHRLFLARDRFGVKPLYYAVCGSELIFASEIKALLKHPEVEPVIDNEGLAEIFGMGPAHTPGLGVFKDVLELKAAHILFWNDGESKARRYWKFRSRHHTDSLGDTAEKVRCLTKKAIISQLSTESPVCTMLSGGLDSSCVTAVAAQNLALGEGERLATYSFDYEDNERYFKSTAFQPDSDERWVRRMTFEFSTKHSFLSANTDDLIKNLEEAVIARDLPGMADIDSSLLHFCKLIRKNHTVAISGECADEIFGGYPWLRAEKSYNTEGFPWSHDFSLRKAILNSDVEKYANMEEYSRARYEECLHEMPRLLGENANDARLREMMYLNINWFMVQLLDRCERISAAAGLDVRVPFCDYALAEYVWNIPREIRFFGDKEKGILRLALKGILPDDVLERRKSPYPKTHNPTYEARVKELLMTILMDADEPICALISREEIIKLMNQPSDVGAPFFGQLMAKPQLYAYLLQTNFWLKHYKVAIR